MKKIIPILAAILLLLSVAVYADTCSVCNETCSPCGGGCDATDLSGMFAYVTSFDSVVGNISGWDTSCITNMSELFRDSDFNQDISGWDTSNVENMAVMFYEDSVFNQPIGSWNVSKVIGFDLMFYSASAFNADISSWDMSSAVSTSWMFGGAISFNQPIGSWNIGKVYEMGNMFESATSFDQDISSWNITSVTNAAGMFNGVSLSTANYDALLLGWSATMDASSSNITGVSFGGGYSQYSPIGKPGRDILTTFYSWTISDGGNTCTPNWVCSSYDNCLENNTRSCLAATDLNICGETYLGDYSELTGDCIYCSHNATLPVNLSRVIIYDSFSRNTISWNLGSADTNQTWWQDSYGGGIDNINHFQYVNGECFVDYANSTWWSPTPYSGYNGISLSPDGEPLVTFEWDYLDLNNTGTGWAGEFSSIDIDYQGTMFTIGFMYQNANGTLGCYSPNSGYSPDTTFVSNDGNWHHFKMVVNISNAESDYWAYMDNQLICNMYYSSWGDVLGEKTSNGEVSLQIFLFGNSDANPRVQLIDDIIGYVGDIYPYICSPDWSCLGYAECLNESRACNETTDLNACGIEYAGNFSEFLPLNCSCVPDWICSGYGACINDSQACNAVTDNNLCGDLYGGNYSEFSPQNCTGGMGGYQVNYTAGDIPNIVGDAVLNVPVQFMVTGLYSLFQVIMILYILGLALIHGIKYLAGKV